MAKEKLYYKIGEACKILDIQPYVLRYWETEFPVLKPSKSKSGQRVFGEEDFALIRRIKELLYEEGFTIAGAKKKLESELEAGGPQVAAEPARAPRRRPPASLTRRRPLLPRPRIRTRAPRRRSWRGYGRASTKRSKKRAGSSTTWSADAPRRAAGARGQLPAPIQPCPRLSLPVLSPLRGIALRAPEPSMRPRTPPVGTWRSLVAHLNGVQGVGSSNLPVPTNLSP